MEQALYNPMALTGRRFLVTGASSGIGRATATLLSRLGARVVCAGRDPARLAATLSQLEGKGHEIAIYDLTQLDEIPAWLRSLTSVGGPLNGLVHAAGVQFTVSLRMLTTEKWRAMLRVNTEAALALVRGFQEHAVHAQAHCAVAFVSSIYGHVGASGMVGYSLSKAALEGMTRSLALELAPQGIRLNCVAPAYVHTTMLETMKKMLTAEQWAQIEAAHPLGIGTPEDVAGAVAFLLADTGKWITGTVLMVDGGYTAR